MNTRFHIGKHALGGAAVVVAMVFAVPGASAQSVTDTNTDRHRLEVSAFVLPYSYLNLESDELIEGGTTMAQASDPLSWGLEFSYLHQRDSGLGMGVRPRAYLSDADKGGELLGILRQAWFRGAHELYVEGALGVGVMQFNREDGMSEGIREFTGIGVAGDIAVGGNLWLAQRLGLWGRVGAQLKVTAGEELEAGLERDGALFSLLVPTISVGVTSRF